MITNCYYLDDFPQAKKAIKRAAPDVNMILTPRGKPRFYPQHVADSWGKDDLLIIEGDIAPTPFDVDRMRDCKAPWCTNWYPLGTTRTPMHVGYGFTKFSLEFQQKFSYDRVMKHGQRPCPICRAVSEGTQDCFDCSAGHMCHLHQDTAMWHEIILMSNNLDISPHVHGKVDHHHLGNRSLLRAERGVLFWRI